MLISFESTRFPFGFLRRRRRLRARNVDLIVYQSRADRRELHLLPMSGGRLTAMRRGAGHDRFSLRDYQPQDDLRHIDWKATARAGRLTVREFTSEDERRITIVLDTRRTDDDKDRFDERFERGVTQAASLVQHFIDERAEVRLLLGTEVEKYGSGIEHLHDCLRRLALVTPDDETADFLTRVAELDATLNLSIAVEGNYAILVTFAARGSIPAKLWRSAHVIHV